MLIVTPFFDDVGVDTVLVQLVLRGAHSKATGGVRGRVLDRKASTVPRTRTSAAATTAATTSTERGSCRRHETTRSFRFVVVDIFIVVSSTPPSVQQTISPIPNLNINSGNVSL